ncbi:MAG: hypothetical protein EOO17_03830 [Chloroflexi bacterium]|nr:MAG: hypothetical protein EOO17_03830 [Chloroflexota bacterium]
MEVKMGKNLLAIYHALVVQFKHNHKKTKMPELKTHLDGSEQSMIPILKHGLGMFPISTKNSIVQLEEFSAGTGISDLTVFSIDKRILKERRTKIGRPLTARNQIKVLTAILSKEDNSLDSLKARTKLSIPTIKKVIDSLKNAGVVTENDGMYSTDYNLKSATSENIIAIEAKVKDWKSGLQQAMRYKEYADYSYLAIYEANINSCLKNIKTFEQLGIGIIGVYDEGVTVHLKAKQSDMTKSESKILAFERMISVIDERHESFIARNGFASYSTS